MKTLVGFLSRAHGYNVLSSLVLTKKYRFLKVYTHKLNPKSQDPTRSIRADYPLFVKCCEENSIPLSEVDNKNENITECPSCDFIIEVSWRYLIPKKITEKARIAAFGIHRGKLPDYAGTEPIKQALLKNEKEIILSAHYLSNKIDEGKVILETKHPVNYDLSMTMEENIQRLRDEITPLFSITAINTMKLLETNF